MIKVELKSSLKIDFDFGACWTKIWGRIEIFSGNNLLSVILIKMSFNQIMTIILFLLGIVVLRNLKYHYWERIFWWICLILFLILILVLSIWNAHLISLEFKETEKSIYSDEVSLANKKWEI